MGVSQLGHIRGLLLTFGGFLKSMAVEKFNLEEILKTLLHMGSLETY